MRWRVASASVPGTAHRATDIACQDHAFCAETVAPCGRHFLFTCCADGAGSATYGGEGAELAVTAARGWLTDRLVRSASCMDQSMAEACLQAVRARLFAAAADLAIPPRALACTLLIAIVAPDELLLAQIGDGGIVIDSGGVLEIPIWPHEGEFTNSTYFITDEDAESRMAFVRKETPVAGIALFTDGLQRLALDFAARAVHAPFFQPLFAHLRTCDGVDKRLLDQGLVRMLESPAINERTDDDKTLVLATSHD